MFYFKNCIPDSKPTYEGLKATKGKFMIQFCKDSKPTYEGLKVDCFIFPVFSLNSKPTYEGLKVVTYYISI